MSLAFSTNKICLNSTDVLFQFKEFMKKTVENDGPGWTVVASSDGVTLTTSNFLTDNITKYGTGLGGLGNNLAWFILRAPGGAPDGYKEFCFQRVGSGSNPDNSFRIKYTNVGFDLSNLSAPTAITVTPTAKTSSVTNLPDERVVLGSAINTDASPSGSAMFNRSQPENLFAHFCADNAAPYGFYILANRYSQPAGFFAFDPIEAGTYPDPALGPGDLDPYVTMVDATSSVLSSASIYNPSSYSTCYMRYNAEYQDNVRVQGFYPVLYDSCQIIGALPSNPYNKKDDTFPLIYARKGSDPYPNGYKGQSSLIRWHGQSRGNFSIATMDVAGDRLVIGNVSIPWNNTYVSV